ncbi:hypothetical protein II906_09750 [bacterium]|nr:hypothetical protein [bacterium]
MGFNVGAINSVNAKGYGIDTEALSRVSEQILNPNNEQTIDVSKLDLHKFNRVSLGLDLYAQRTDSNKALQSAKAASDFGVNFSKEFNANIQYLNSIAAQSLFTSKENNGRVVISVNNGEEVNEKELLISETQVSQTSEMDKDKKGSNPFSFYMAMGNGGEKEENQEPLF